MADAQIQIVVPSELNNLGQLAQSVIEGFQAGQKPIQILAGALPALMSEGANYQAVLAEVKDPKSAVVYGVVLGQIAAKLWQALLDKKAKAAAAAPAAAAALPPAPAV